MPCFEWRTTGYRVCLVVVFIVVLLLLFAPDTGRRMTGYLSRSSGGDHTLCAADCECWKSPPNMSATGRTRWCAYIGVLTYANIALLALLCCPLLHLARAVLQEMASARRDDSDDSE